MKESTVLVCARILEQERDSLEARIKNVRTSANAFIFM